MHHRALYLSKRCLTISWCFEPHTTSDTKIALEGEEDRVRTFVWSSSRRAKPFLNCEIVAHCSCRLNVHTTHSQFNSSSAPVRCSYDSCCYLSRTVTSARISNDDRTNASHIEWKRYTKMDESENGSWQHENESETSAKHTDTRDRWATQFEYSQILAHANLCYRLTGTRFFRFQFSWFRTLDTVKTQKKKRFFFLISFLIQKIFILLRPCARQIFPSHFVRSRKIVQ